MDVLSLSRTVSLPRVYITDHRQTRPITITIHYNFSTSDIQCGGIMQFCYAYSSHSVCICLDIAELGQLSGVAAILRFPLPEPEDDESSDEDEHT